MKPMDNELKQFAEYLFNPGSEKAKDHLAFPLFKKLFGPKFKKESDAQGADTYIEGKLLVELKSDNFLPGFYQALHYAKKGLTFSAVCVVSRKFVAVWKVNQIPDEAKRLSSGANSAVAPSAIGSQNASKTSKGLAAEILRSAVFKLDSDDLQGLFARKYDTAINEFVQVLSNLDAERIQINTHNFIDHISQLERFFPEPIEAIHCFYAIVGFWDVTSTVALDEESDTVRVLGKKGSRLSEAIRIKPKLHGEFTKFVEQRFVFTNEGSGLTVDYYFSRFDEVITRIKPEYAKQHGIFFTDNNLSKFALWFVHQYFEKRLSEKYIVMDPAGGSGNLVTSWRGHLKRKIISELQPDLLKTIERRMKLDPDQLAGGFTIIPKTSKNEGLNFLDKSAEEYLAVLMKDLSEQNFKFDKPIAFLLNPPYKNTDENEKEREEVDAAYAIHRSILDLTGEDAGRERYLAFLGQIINISRLQLGDNVTTDLGFDESQLPAPLDPTKVGTPLILVFTPTSWLVPRPTYLNFRKVFDSYFKYECGFIVLGSEFFKIAGRFPISFTIWSYKRNTKGNKNNITLRDLTDLKSQDLAINWNQGIGQIEGILKKVMKGVKTVNFSAPRESIKASCGQQMFDFKRDPTAKELGSGVVYGGLPIKDERRRNKKTYGIPNSTYLGFMDNSTPVRIKPRDDGRFSPDAKSVWFRFDTAFLDMNKSRCMNLPPDQKGYAAFDLPSAQKTFVWYAITKALNGKYPVWANQMEIWRPNIPSAREAEFYALCFAFGLAENRCVVTKFEKDDPVSGAPEVFVDNSLCPSNRESFWSTTLDDEVKGSGTLAFQLVELVKHLYRTWDRNHTKGQVRYSVGLQDEPYFKYFEYKDFVTPYSGITQIRRYAELHNAEDLLKLLEAVTVKSAEVRTEIHRLLVDEFSYFG